MKTNSSVAEFKTHDLMVQLNYDYTAGNAMKTYTKNSLL